MYKINKQERYIIRGNSHYIVVVEALSCVWLFVIPWTAAHQVSLSFTNFQSLLRLTSVKLVMLSNHLIQNCPLLLPLILPSIRYFPVSQLFISGSQSTGASSLAWVLSINIQDWFSLGLTGLISLLSKGLSRVYSSTTIWRYQFSGTQFLWSNSHTYTWLLEKS